MRLVSNFTRHALHAQSRTIRLEGRSARKPRAEVPELTYKHQVVKRACPGRLSVSSFARYSEQAVSHTVLLVDIRGPRLSVSLDLESGQYNERGSLVWEAHPENCIGLGSCIVVDTGEVVVVLCLVSRA